MKKRKLLSICLVFSLISCNKDISGTWESYVMSIVNIPTTANTYVAPFNTMMQINYFLNGDNDPSINEEVFSNVTSLFEQEIARLHILFDRHYEYKDNQDVIKNLKIINNSYGSGTPVQCSKELYELLKIGVEVYELSNGMFNIFTGQLTNYWEKIFSDAYNYEPLNKIDPYFNAEQKLKLEQIVDATPLTVEEIKAQLTFDDENKTVTFNKTSFNNDIAPIISVGGIAKGYATDIIKEKLKENNYTEGYLISGGSSISSLAKPIYTKEAAGQKINVINPAKSNFFEKEIAFSLKATEEFSFSTSGNYTTNKSYSFVDNDGNRIYRHHIINPFTGYPESYYRSVSIFTNSFSNYMVDVLSTTFMNLSIQEGLLLRKSILAKNPDYNFEILYLTQEKDDKNAICKVHATSNINGTLQATEGISIIYEN